ncbi:mannose-6-phosphate isomerase [Streptomyces atratus]|uniref:Phospho-glucose isomerase C-terminal SIS domain-containing protein n=1 Tax=Streptomyces atratus TaxID=1893 RepID=A0A1K2EUX4_STRAR|nr:SIS domain-containing protein [Streptomyces atratus]SFY39431.1 phospho-glucose isomerase C-terminal SIS domain-containing protein [Streptomyces atratus]
MLDESLLDAPEALARADRRGLLRGAAEAGARVRTAALHAAEAGIAELNPEGRPRAVLVAGSGTAASGVADLITALAGASAPVTRIHPTGVAPAPGAMRWTLPGWAGSVDLLLIVTADGSEPGLSLLAEQAYRRGCSVVAVAPRQSPLREAIDGAHGLVIPMASAPHGEYDAETSAAGPGTLWALFTPLLALLDRVGLLTAPAEALQSVADRLDRTAERCGPSIATYSNPAKTLAAELAESLPLIWTEGDSAAPVGRRFAAVLAELSGRPALAAELPEALPAHGTLLAGTFAAGADPDDFFRDRVDEPEPLHARVVLIRDRPTGGLSAAPAARELALGHDTAVSELEPDEGTELEALAELLAVTDFAAVYLALASASGA